MKPNYVEPVKMDIIDTIDLVKEVRADISKTEEEGEKLGGLLLRKLVETPHELETPKNKRKQHNGGDATTPGGNKRKDRHSPTRIEGSSKIKIIKTGKGLTKRLQRIAYSERHRTESVATQDYDGSSEASQTWIQKLDTGKRAGRRNEKSDGY